jgi:hypothetical protein
MQIEALEKKLALA